MADWYKRYVDAAKFYATWSKDESTSVGAVIYNPNTHAILMDGYNGFPRGVNDDIPERKARPLKYLYTVHAETNAIYNAARNGVALEGMGMALDWHPCARCAGAIVQSGIIEIVCGPPDLTHERWGEDFRVAKQILDEASAKTGLRVIIQDQEKRL